MKRMLQTVSRTALVAMIAMTPVAAVAQTAEPVGEEAELLKKRNGAAAEATGPDATNHPANQALTQDTEEPADAPETDLAEEEEEILPNDPASTDVATDAAPTIGDDEQIAADAASKPVEGHISMQDANTVLAEDLLGATVFNGENENVGDINDLIIGLNGEVKGVIIGVGGFLGMGEKDVAVEMAALDVVDQNGRPRLMTSASKADLEAAPAFVSARDQATAQQQVEMQSSGGTLGGVAPTE